MATENARVCDTKKFTLGKHEDVGNFPNVDEFVPKFKFTADQMFLTQLKNSLNFVSKHEHVFFKDVCLSLRDGSVDIMAGDTQKLLYYTSKLKYERLCKLYIDSNETVEITEDIIKEVEWFDRFIYCNEVFVNNDIELMMENQNTERAEKFLRIFKNMFPIFIFLIAEWKGLSVSNYSSKDILKTEIDEEMIRYLNYPNAYFDKYMYNRDRRPIEMKQSLDNDNHISRFIIRKMYYVIRYILNRKDEYKYDLSKFEENTEEICNVNLFYYKEKLNEIKVDDTEDAIEDYSETNENVV
jgi:hypothetical protein